MVASGAAGRQRWPVPLMLLLAGLCLAPAIASADMPDIGSPPVLVQSADDESGPDAGDGVVAPDTEPEMPQTQPEGEDEPGGGGAACPASETPLDLLV